MVVGLGAVNPAFAQTTQFPAGRVIETGSVAVSMMTGPVDSAV
jgi:hypothetical protein